MYTLHYFRQIDETAEMTENNQPASFCESSREASLFKKLKTGLDSARSLIKCLRSEKGRLMKRELSVEMRLGEMEDYKSHIKQDLVSLLTSVETFWSCWQTYKYIKEKKMNLQCETIL